LIPVTSTITPGIKRIIVLIIAISVPWDINNIDNKIVRDESIINIIPKNFFTAFPPMNL